MFFNLKHTCALDLMTLLFWHGLLDYYEWLNTNFDIIFISETHLTKGQSFKLLDYKEFHNSYSDCTKPCGGLSCFIKNHLLQYVEEVEKVNEGNILIIFKGGNIVFGSYIPPVGSPLL